MTKVKKQTDIPIEEVQQQTDEWKSKYLRALADYQNLERRHREEKADMHTFANEVLLGKLVHAIDTLVRAKDHLKDPGLDLAFKEFTLILGEYGVEKIQTVGCAFTPHEMECVEVVDLPASLRSQAQAGGEDGIVTEELQPGYRLNGKILRVAKVKVGKNKQNVQNAQNTQ